MAQEELELGGQEPGQPAAAADASGAAGDGRTELFETLHEVTLYAAHNLIRLHTWGNRSYALPPGTTSATLVDEFIDEDQQARLLQLKCGDVLLFQELYSPLTGDAEDANPEHRHVVRLQSVIPGHDRVYGQPVLEVAWRPSDALPFPLVVSATVQTREGAKDLTNLAVVRGNVVLADHGRRLPPEALPLLEAAKLRGFDPDLEEQGLTRRKMPTAEMLKTGAAAGVLLQDPREAMPCLTLAVDGQALDWEPQRDLLDSTRFDPHFVVETDQRGRPLLRFGDDVMGKRPAPGTIFMGSYRVGNGTRGNVGMGAIDRMWGQDEAGHAMRGFISGVFNPLPARGGTDPEPLEQVRLLAPHAFREQMRAVTEADYARIAERHPEVAKAVARRRWTGSWFTMFVAVDREGGHPVDGAFRRELSAFLDAFRLSGQDLEVIGPQWRPLDLAMSFTVSDNHSRRELAAELAAVFGSGVRPDGRRGLFHPDRLTFGQPVYLSALVAEAMALPGVVRVETDPRQGRPNRFASMGRKDFGEWLDGRILAGPLEIIRMDNDPGAPEKGRFRFNIQGGL